MKTPDYVKKANATYKAKGMRACFISDKLVDVIQKYRDYGFKDRKIFCDLIADTLKK